MTLTELLARKPGEAEIMTPEQAKTLDEVLKIWDKMLTEDVEYTLTLK